MSTWGLFCFSLDRRGSEAANLDLGRVARQEPDEEVHEDADREAGQERHRGTSAPSTILRSVRPRGSERSTRSTSRAGSTPCPDERTSERLAHEDRLDREVLAQSRDDREDLHDLTADGVSVVGRDVVAVEMDDEIEGLRTNQLPHHPRRDGMLAST
jgi:hypothetical protein